MSFDPEVRHMIAVVSLKKAGMALSPIWREICRLTLIAYEMAGVVFVTLFALALTAIVVGASIVMFVAMVSAMMLVVFWPVILFVAAMFWLFSLVLP